MDEGAKFFLNFHAGIKITEKNEGGTKMLYASVKDFPDAIIFEKEKPCISLYQPTHRHSPNSKQDTIIFKNLIRQVENSLKEKYQKKEIEGILKPLLQIEQDKSFWNKTLDGLAILASPSKCIVYRLNRTVPELAIVADSFHIKLLLRYFQSTAKYQILGLSANDFSLYEGNRYGIEELEFDPDVPRNIKEVLGNQYTDSFLSHGSHGGREGGPAMFFGHGGRKDEKDKDVEKFFRYVDKFVLENYSRKAKLPLILASLDEHQGMFRKISKNSYLMDEGIKGSYDSFKLEQLTEKAWEIILPVYLEKTKKLTDVFQIAKGNASGTDSIEEATKMAFESRIETVMIEADKLVPGKIDPHTGEIKFGSMDNPAYDDVLDDLAELVLSKRGEVIVLPKERMPSDTGVAAIYR